MFLLDAKAIASMMACMMFRDMATIEPYYVVSEKYNTVLLEEKRNQETERMKDIITLPEYKIKIPNEKLIKCMHMISLHRDNKITKRELKDLALNKNLIQVGKNDTQDMEEHRDQVAVHGFEQKFDRTLDGVEIYQRRKDRLTSHCVVI